MRTCSQSNGCHQNTTKGERQSLDGETHTLALHCESAVLRPDDRLSLMATEFRRRQLLAAPYPSSQGHKVCVGKWFPSHWRKLLLGSKAGTLLLEHK